MVHYRRNALYFVMFGLLCAIVGDGIAISKSWASDASVASASDAHVSSATTPLLEEIKNASSSAKIEAASSGSAGAASAEKKSDFQETAKLPEPVVSSVSPSVSIEAKSDASSVAEKSATQNALPSAVASETMALPPVSRVETVVASRGGTLMDMLVGAGAPRGEADAALNALGAFFNPRQLKIGQQVQIQFERHDGIEKFIGLRLRPDVVHTLTVARDASGAFHAVRAEKTVERKTVAVAAVIHSSLFEAGMAAGVPIPVMMSIIRIYSYNVDFQRDFQSGDQFSVLFERDVTVESGQTAREGDVLFASLILSGRELPIYRFKGSDGRVDYFNRLGESVRKALLRTPIDGARLTSGFGLRHHPILGYTKMHQGVDFSASTGTPIYAAGNGLIEELGPKNGYGNYIRIRHNSEFSTAYGHMSRFAADSRRGGRVDQGDVIGYVGATGRATGPHLHYEVLRNSHQINPMSVDIPVGRKLEGKEFQSFLAAAGVLDQSFLVAREKNASQVSAVFSHECHDGHSC
ncbi:murein DD-endopeptidase [Azospirillaceae bacterium]